MTERAVIKFGGADLANGRRIKEAAEKVVRSGFDEIIVVVSAMGTTTDKLVELSDQMDVCEKDYAEIVSMGERTSARVFSSALKDLGERSRYLVPSQEDWPIFTDNRYTAAEPDLEQSRGAFEKNVVPSLSEDIPVICGFLGKDTEGNTTTLGRGGSDTTALVAGNCIGADEVILVKETEGLLTGDPDLIEGSRFVSEIHIEELFALAHGGAEIVRYQGLRYKLPGQVLRIVPFSSDDLSEGGTEVCGEFSSCNILNEQNDLSAVTVICDLNPYNLNSIFAVLNQRGDVEVSGISSGEKSITIFGGFDGEDIVRYLHRNLDSFKAITHREDVCLLEVTHPRFVDHPGWVARITKMLSSRDINIIEVTTSKATINIYLDDVYMKDAISIIEQMFVKGSKGMTFKKEEKGDLVEI